MSEYDKTNMSEETVLTPEEQRDRRFEKVQRRLLVIAVLLLLVLVLPLSVRPSGTGGITVLEPDYALVPDETHAVISDDQTQTKLEASANGGAVAMIYSDQIGYDMATDTLNLSFTNPSSSTAAVILQIFVTGPDGSEYLLAESGALKPGYTVSTLDSDKDSNVGLAQGVYNGVMRVLYYNADTGERAIVNSDIVVQITVQ